MTETRAGREDRRPTEDLGGVRRFVRTTVVDPLREFLATEAAGSVLLLLGAVAALLWANSPWSDSYSNLWHHHMTLDLGSLEIEHDVADWIADGPMALFFLVVGLEIKREFARGELSDLRAAMLPIAAAVGGMVLPALIFVAVTAGSEAVSGWGVPMATDIAFAVGLLLLVGRHAPIGLRLLLLSIAIVDDIGAILVIALFYGGGVELRWLALAAVAILGLIGLHRAGVTRLSAYVPFAVLVWLATLASGVHATIAGVVLGLLMPAGREGSYDPIDELEDRLHPVSSFIVLPLFALASAGVTLSVDSLGGVVTSRAAWGVVLGLLVGKTLGIAGAAWLAVRMRWGRLPEGLTMGDVIAMAPLAGIGFTVSLFIATLAFDGSLLAETKTAILIGSIVSGAVGALTLRTRVARFRGAETGDTSGAAPD